MSQNNECGCGHPQLTMLPVHGFGLAVDASGLVPAPVPTPTGRERVDHDMHIYVNGNLSASGDGLSPETAVKSYEDAILALSRYDGCNTYHAYFHFADLAGSEDVYPSIDIYPHSYATFLTLTIAGVSHETTMLGRIYNTTAAHLTLTDACTPFAASLGWLNISGKVALKPSLPVPGALQANWGGHIRFLSGSEIFFNPGKYASAVYSANGHMVALGAVKFHTLGAVDAGEGFVRLFGNACVWLNQEVDFSTCSAVTGRKYNLTEQACLVSAGLALPGSLPGVTANNALYL